MGSCSSLSKVSQMPSYGCSNSNQPTIPGIHMEGTTRYDQTQMRDNKIDSYTCRISSDSYNEVINKERIKEKMLLLEKPDIRDSFDFKETPRIDLDSCSVISGGQTGRSMVFPDPTEIEILTHTPPRVWCNVRIENTFWRGKKMLIPDYSVMEKIDEHVLTVSLCLCFHKCNEVNY